MQGLLASCTVFCSIFLAIVAFYQMRQITSSKQSQTYLLKLADSRTNSLFLGWILLLFAFFISGLHWGWEFGSTIFIGVLSTAGLLFVYLLEKQRNRLKPIFPAVWWVLLLSPWGLVLSKYFAVGA